MSDVVIIGAGFIGMSFALAAHKQGFGVEVYDRAAAPVLPKAATSQVIAVNPVSADFLAKIGVWDLIPDMISCRSLTGKEAGRSLLLQKKVDCRGLGISLTNWHFG